MADILDYVALRGDITFAERPFNDVDSLIITELAYLDLDDIVPGRYSDNSVSIREVCKQYIEKGIDQSYMINDPKPLLQACADSDRFGDVRFTAFVNMIDEKQDMQFAAVTAIIDDDLIYVAFRGTDDSLAGWKEDCNISYQNETAGQREAAKYLDQILERQRSARDIICGGHSKGGNLAIYASAFCEHIEKNMIKKIYSHDGPGFNETVSRRREYRSVLHKVNLSVPETSIVGILLSNTRHRNIVKSNAKGPVQHNPYTWQVTRTGFDTASEQSDQGVFLNEALNRWIDGLDPGERKNFVTTVFEVLEASGASTITEINANKRVSFNAIIKAARNLDQERQKAVLSVLKELADISRDMIWDETVKSFRSRIASISKD